MFVLKSMVSATIMGFIIFILAVFDKKFLEILILLTLN